MLPRLTATVVLLVVAVGSAVAQARASTADPVQWVNPLIGT
ncbi:MAG: hypothetical protein JWR44_1879, partial [Hymenobacter sp.]|nr:hypothetical protein [Hymenobacter sp.]